MKYPGVWLLRKQSFSSVGIHTVTVTPVSRPGISDVDLLYAEPDSFLLYWDKSGISFQYILSHQARQLAFISQLNVLQR